jgi:hypothetical protein
LKEQEYIFATAKEKATDSIAQLVEHLPFKERVLGSSPSRVTILFLTPCKPSVCKGFFFIG